LIETKNLDKIIEGKREWSNERGEKRSILFSSFNRLAEDRKREETHREKLLFRLAASRSHWANCLALRFYSARHLQHRATRTENEIDLENNLKEFCNYFSSNNVEQCLYNE
jgi:hypothetical protein